MHLDTKLNLMKLKSSSSAFQAIQPDNELGLSSWGLQGECHQRNLAKTIVMHEQISTLRIITSKHDGYHIETPSFVDLFYQSNNLTNSDRR